MGHGLKVSYKLGREQEVQRKREQEEINLQSSCLEGNLYQGEKYIMYYRKRGSVSYIVREVRSVRERDTESERE